VNRTLDASLSQKSKTAYENALVRLLQWYYQEAKDYLTPGFLGRVPPGTQSLSAEFIKDFLRGSLGPDDYPFIERHLTSLHIIHYFQDLGLTDNIKANSLASHRSAWHHLRSLCHQPATEDLKKKLKKFWKGLKREELRAEREELWAQREESKAFFPEMPTRMFEVVQRCMGAVPKASVAGVQFPSGAGVSLPQMQVLIQSQLEPIVASLRALQAGLPAAVPVRPPEGPATTPLFWGGRMRRVSREFQVPSVTLQAAFRLWCVGSDRHPPLRQLEPVDLGDFSHKSDAASKAADALVRAKRGQLSALRSVMLPMENELKTQSEWNEALLSQQQLPVGTLNEWYALAVPALAIPQQTTAGRVRRLEHMKWTTVRREVLYASSSKSARRANASPGAALGDAAEEQEDDAGDAMDD
jgi:hypothetical protein